MQHEHESRVFLHGVLYVVGTFVLAYLPYYTSIAKVWQYVLDERAKIYCRHVSCPHSYTSYPQINRGDFDLWINHTVVSGVICQSKSTTPRSLWKTFFSRIIESRSTEKTEGASGRVKRLVAECFGGD